MARCQARWSDQNTRDRQGSDGRAGSRARVGRESAPRRSEPDGGSRSLPAVARRIWLDSRRISSARWEGSKQRRQLLALAQASDRDPDRLASGTTHDGTRKGIAGTTLARGPTEAEGRDSGSLLVG